MCEYFSCILMRDGTVLTSDDSNSHDDIIKKYNLEDVKLQDRDFIRIEITPNKSIHLFSRARCDWTFKEDEEGTLPGWYDEDMMALREKCWTAWESSVERLIHSKMDVPKMFTLIDELKSIDCLDNHDEPLPEWKLYDTRVAAWYAIEDTVLGAVWDAIEDTVKGTAIRVAVWDAVWDAVKGTVLGAVWDAVSGVVKGTAIRVAVWDVIRDATVYVLANSMPNMEPEHIDHINRRMDVWKRGYGCYRDVNGVLYCYRRD